MMKRNTLLLPLNPQFNQLMHDATKENSILDRESQSIIIIMTLLSDIFITFNVHFLHFVQGCFNIHITNQNFNRTKRVQIFL
jgi:hypothetical protein